MQSFVEVIKLGSFSQAAKLLGLSRALVSRHVADLEKHLGVPCQRARGGARVELAIQISRTPNFTGDFHD